MLSRFKRQQTEPSPNATEHSRTGGLRRKLMQLSLMLTAIGLLMLVISLAAVFWLRTNANHLATQRAPAIAAARQAQIGLQSTLAGLRGWAALGRERFRTERQAAWVTRVTPALAEIHRLRVAWPDPADQQQIVTLDRLLMKLKESQWWVEDVAQAEGNHLALRVLRQRVEPIADSISRATNAFIADIDQDHFAILQAVTAFQVAFLSTEHRLTQFVTHGEGKNAKALATALTDVHDALAVLVASQRALNPLQQDYLVHLATELPWYTRFAREAMAARHRADWNFALYLMNSETVPLTQEASSQLDALVARQKKLMRRATQSMTLVGNAVTVLSLVLILLMALSAYTLANYRADQITQPITRLSAATVQLAAGSLKDDLPVTTDDELASLTEAFNRMRVNLQESETALREANERMRSELESAAEYIQSVLPPKLQGSDSQLRSDWVFLASSKLGGDFFGYHWLDETRLALYLLDVSGHGIASSLLAISVHETLRQKTLPDTRFEEPADVLTALNHAFPMEQHHDNFFTIWYGVYDVASRLLRYTCGGHHAALLMTNDSPDKAPNSLVQLGVKNAMIGVLPDTTFEVATHHIPAGSRLYLFSDGVFEVFNPDQQMLDFHGLVDILTHTRDDGSSRVQQVLEQARAWQRTEAFADDYSMVEITFL